MKRRNLLLFGTGAAAGVVLSPAPWKITDDVSIWTQNWSWTPVPPRGEITAKYTTCTLCPAACGVRARCVGGQPVGLTGVAGHPVSRGRLCAVAYGAHQLPYHKQRVTEFRSGGSKCTRQDGVDLLAQRLRNGGRVVFLDMQPGRAVSSGLAKLAAAVPQGVYATLESPRFGLDFENAKTIVSFGAPLLERWVSQPRLWEVWSRDNRPKLIQIEAVQSRTAALADQWIAIRPGAEQALVAALAGSGDAGHSGVTVEVLASLKQTLQEEGVLVVGGGITSPLVQRAPSPVASPTDTPLHAIEAGSVALMIIDHGMAAACPEDEALRRALAPKATVVSLSPYAAGLAARSDLFVPTAAWLEAASDAIEAWDATVPSYALAPALLKAPEGITDELEFLAAALQAAGIAVEPPSRDAEIQQRIAALHAFKKGQVFTFADAATKPVTEFESADKLREAFDAGACWTGEPPKPAARDAQVQLAARPQPAVLPPLACKLHQESKLFTRMA